MNIRTKRPINTVRIVKISCTNEIGQTNQTFTVDENSKQNSPSFDSYNNFIDWKNKLINYAFRTDLEYTKQNYTSPCN